MSLEVLAFAAIGGGTLLEVVGYDEDKMTGGRL